MAIFAILSISVINLTGGPETHSVSIAVRSREKLGKETSANQIIRLCVDSGATSGCISKARMNIMKITNTRPKANVKQ